MTPWSTALVTGASSGIGEAIARELAARGVPHLVLVARRQARLDELAAHLGTVHGTTCEVLVADLARRDGPGSLAVVEARLAEPGARPAVDLLVNNAGIGTSGPFATLPIEDEQRELDVNVTAVVRLARAALGPMVASGRGSVLNVSSLASYQPSPGMATYGATKAFVTLFSETLHEELRGSGVTVTALLPGYTRTEFQRHLGDGEASGAPDAVFLPAERVASIAVDATIRGRALCIPGAGYKVAGAVVTPLPRSARRWLMGRLAGRATRLAARLDR